MCFYADLSDLAQTFRTHVLGDIVQDVGLSLKDASPWDLVLALLT